MNFRNCLLLVAAFIAISTAARADNYSDIWWNPSESGWGVTIADHETNMFSVIYTYASNGQPTWFVISGGTFSQGRRIFQGDVYATKGPPYTNATFDPNLVKQSNVGTVMFDFAPPGLTAGNALLSYTINGVSQTKQIVRFGFGSAPAAWGTDGSDIWYNATESGWGLAIAQHGNNVFAVWFTYDSNGAPIWMVIPGGQFTDAKSFSGPMYRATGPYFATSPFDSSRVTLSQVGTAALLFDAPVNKSASPLEKAQDACPGLGMDFVATIGGQGIPRLVCKLPFGNIGPGISANALANLTPYAPNGWSDKIVVSTSPGATTDSSALRPTDNLFVSWAVLNNGTASTTISFNTKLFVNGVLSGEWIIKPPLDPNFYSYLTGFSIGMLPEGTYSLRVATDVNNAVPESNESDNEYTRSITVTKAGSAGQFYYANWVCSSSQCASVMGGYAGTYGPFCSLTSCDAWRQTYITSSACSTTPTYTPVPGGASCY